MRAEIKQGTQVGFKHGGELRRGVVNGQPWVYFESDHGAQARIPVYSDGDCLDVAGANVVHVMEAERV